MHTYKHVYTYIYTYMHKHIIHTCSVFAQNLNLRWSNHA